MPVFPVNVDHALLFSCRCNNEPDIHPEYQQLTSVLLMPQIGSAA